MSVASAGSFDGIWAVPAKSALRTAETCRASGGPASPTLVEGDTGPQGGRLFCCLAPAVLN